MSAPPGWVSIRSALPGIEIWKPEPGAPPLASCPRCGGPTGLDGGSPGCGFCGWEPSVATQGGAPLTRSALEAGPWLGRRRVSCASCGAERAEEEGLYEGSCAFCGSAALVAVEGSPGPQPAGVVRHGAAPAGARRAFAPVWWFDVDFQVSWRGRVGVGKTRGPAGGRRVVYRLAWEERRGSWNLPLRDHPVSAVGRLALEARGGEVVPFQPAELVGAQVFLPDVALADAFDVVRRHARGAAWEEATRALGGDAQSGVEVVVRSRAEGWRLILWPLWVTPRGMVDGRSGRSVVVAS